MRKGYFLFIACMQIFSSLPANTHSVTTFAAEWLYMLPAIEQPYFVIDRVQVGPVEFEEKRFRNEQSWQSGYRLELDYLFNQCQNAFQLRWTHFPTFSESKKLTGTDLIPVITIPAAAFPQLFNTAEIEDTFHFHYLDFLFCQKLINLPCFALDLLGGIQYGCLNFEEDIRYLGNANELVEDIFFSRTWGIGFEIGSELFFRLMRCLDVRGRGYVSLLASKDEVRRKRVITQNAILTGLGDLVNEDYWDLLPMANVRLGLAYHRQCWKQSRISIEAGYEMITFFRSIDRIFFTSPEPPQSGSIDQLMNFSMHGPFLRLELSY